MEEERFSLKDYLFHREKVEKIAREIKSVYPSFKEKQFVKQIVDKFSELELLERVYCIRDVFEEFLPKDFRKAVDILISSLPPPADPKKSDADFGDFIYAPYSYFVAKHGCNKKNLKFSLGTMKALTTRFSVEGPIRFFVNAFPKEILVELKKWAKDNHYHVRRLASEGTRPFLPWAQKININYHKPVPILDTLYRDKTRFVTRSVANHINDISKIDSKLVISLLKKWKKDGKQNEKEMAFIISHSLRTLVKEGNIEALKMLGFSSQSIVVNGFAISTRKVKVGGTLGFSFEITSTSKDNQDLMVDYIIHFKKNNETHAPKTFKIGRKMLKGGESIKITKRHPLKLMTTRKLYHGTQGVELQINGKKFGRLDFELVQ